MVDLQESFRYDDNGQKAGFKPSHHANNDDKKTTSAPITTETSLDEDTSLEEALLQLIENERSEITTELRQRNNDQQIRHQRCLIKDTTPSPPEMAMGPFDDVVEIEALDLDEEIMEELLERASQILK